MGKIQLETPSLALLPAYVLALEAGWSPDNIRKEAAAREQLEAIAQAPEAFVASLDDPTAAGGPIPLPDGTVIPRLPGITRWIFDDHFCGSIGFRWQPGTSILPPHVPGHMGFSIVPWKRGNGYAGQALRLMLAEAQGEGLEYVELTVDPENLASQKVIASSGGILVERFRKAAAYGGAEALRFRIALGD
ncbi:GNAT family N-acetyltransferase [Paraburkholderia sp. B3]|uniref:GNAT family N-acetyltransferase n=1 Tax=Paraburkholderia sp. B3 TaxID=3134791 RepID=UPI00398247E7